MRATNVIFSSGQPGDGIVRRNAANELQMAKAETSRRAGMEARRAPGEGRVLGEGRASRE